MEHHGAALLKLTKNQALTNTIKIDYNQVELEHQTKVILDFAVKLTLNPQGVVTSDTDLLRQSGLDDRGILEVCHVVSYFNFVNRMASGLGVELET